MTPYTVFRVCPKCGSDNIKTQFKEAAYIYSIEPEHLRLTCVCGYIWRMECADKIPSPETPSKGKGE